MNPGEVRVAFMGSPPFAVPSLRGLVEAGYRVVAAITQPDRPAGRGGRTSPPAVKVAALEVGVPVLQPASLKPEPVQAELAALDADVFVVAAYGKILPQRVLDLPARGSLNVHASLLPRWRGASPITAAILAGDPETGVSIMELVLKMDAGPVVAARATPLVDDDTTGSIEARLAAIGARTLLEVLPGWFDRSLEPAPQDDSLATYCSLVQKSDGFLRAAMDVHQAERAVRAYNPWPGASVGYGDRRLLIWRAHIATAQADTGLPGDMMLVGRLPAVSFAGGLLVLDEVQLPGGRRLNGADFVNGERGRLLPRVELV